MGNQGWEIDCTCFRHISASSLAAMATVMVWIIVRGTMFDSLYLGR